MRGAILSILAGTALALGATAANATTFTGSTLGCFGGGCTVANASATGGASFTSGTFNQADSNGFLSIGSVSGGDTLGIISVSGLSSTWVNVPFSLMVNFTAPAGTSPTGALYSALLTGSVSSDGAGGAFFDFNNTPQNFTFTGGTFSLFVNDLAISSGQTLNLNGVIRTSAAVPEPATWGLMLLGFGGIGMAMRRRRRPALAQIA
jgi:hypothetical protein